MSSRQISSATLISAHIGSSRRHQKGFTLVEIGVVLVIIGLLLGAVLKGQELIGSARVSNLISNMNGYKAAINSFQDRYRIVPGHSSTASSTVGNGAVNYTQDCNNGLVESHANISLVNNHLLAAGVYSGPALKAETTEGPTSTGYLNNPGGGPIHLLYYRNFLVSGGGQSANSVTGPHTGWNLSSKLLGEVDRKMDDGNGRTGGVRFAVYGAQAASGCVNSATGAWIENSPGTNCHAVELWP